MLSIFGQPDKRFLDKSLNTLIVCRKGGENDIVVVDACCIEAVVAMPPLPLMEIEAADESYQDLYYVAEKPGLEVFQVGGDSETADDEGGPPVRATTEGSGRI